MLVRWRLIDIGLRGECLSGAWVLLHVIVLIHHVCKVLAAALIILLLLLLLMLLLLLLKVSRWHLVNKGFTLDYSATIIMRLVELHNGILIDLVHRWRVGIRFSYLLISISTTELYFHLVGLRHHICI